MILRAPLGDVMQEQRHVERTAMVDRVNDLVGQGMGPAQPSGFEIGEMADGADQMLVHRVMVVHVELHHRHDPPEIRHEPAEHPGLVHAPQDALRLVLRGDDLEEQGIGPLVAAQIGGDQLQRTGGEARGIGMNGEVVPVGLAKQGDQIDRITLENAVILHTQTVIVDDELADLAPARCGAAEAPDEAVEHRDMLGLTGLHRRTDDRGEIPPLPWR